MLELSPDIWRTIRASGGGDGVLTASLLRRLREQEDEDAWAELHHQINHQGTVGETAYVAAPHIVVIAEHASTHMRALLLSTLGSVVASGQAYAKTTVPIRPAWLDEYEGACRQAQQLAAETLAQPIENDEDSWMLIEAISAFHGHTNLAMLLGYGPNLSCPKCGEDISYNQS